MSYQPRQPPLSPEQRNGHHQSSLPPGAMLPAAPGSKNIPQSTSMNEFGMASYGGGPGSGPGPSRLNQTLPVTSTHRTLPTPASIGSGGRRPLPVPPRPPPRPEESIYAQTGRPDPSASLPTSLPIRTLPTLPPSPRPPPHVSSNDRPPTPPPKIAPGGSDALRQATLQSSPVSYDVSNNAYRQASNQSRTPSTLSHSTFPEQSYETLGTSLEGMSVDRDDPNDNGGGTNVTLRPPATLGQEGGDGRKTPTPKTWTDSEEFRRPPPPLSADVRQRTTSSSTIGAIDAQLPATPKMVPGIIHHTRLTSMDSRSDLSTAQHLTPPTESGPSMSRSSSDVALAEREQAYASGSGPGPRTNVLQRNRSQASSMRPSITSSFQSAGLSPSWGEQSQEPSGWVRRKLELHQSQVDGEYEDGSGADMSMYDDEDDGYDEGDGDEDLEVNEIRFFQPAFLSEAALQLRDRVDRRRQTKAGIVWQGSFTGRDIVTTIQNFLPSYTRDGPNDRRFALLLAQSLQNQLWFVEVDWDIKPLRDSPEDVFRFMGEMEGIGAGDGLNSELPSGLMTMATRCYSPSCPQDSRCYASRCPYKQTPGSFLQVHEAPATPEPSSAAPQNDRGEWTDRVDPRILRDLSEDQYNRQTIIRQAIQQEVQYQADLQAMEDLYITGLRNADPPIIPRHRLERFIAEVFSNEAEIHEACGRLLDHFTIRERESEQPPLIFSVGDIFLQAAADFRNIYPEYTGNLPSAENVLRQEMEDNADFRFFCDRIVRENDSRRHIKYLITRPSDQLQRCYPAVLESILNITEPTEPDFDFLTEALSSIQNLSAISQLKLFHASKGRGQAGKKQWPDLVPVEMRKDIPRKEQKRQMQIWELIQGEMEYVDDLETMDTLFVDKLRIAENGPIIERPRVEIFLDDAFHNYRSLLEVHSRLLESLQTRQLEQHPHVGAIGDLLLDAALNWQDAYMEYVTHYPIAKAKVQEEERNNARFAAFLKECLKDPASHRQDIYHFINRPIPRLLRYPLLLESILESLKESGAPEDHPDFEGIPQAIELIKDLGRATQKGVANNESKVELWTYQHSLDGSRFGARVVQDLDLLNPMRELIHRGKVFRQPEGPMSSWAELTVLLFDNYFVLVKPEKQRSSRREERQERYTINRRPIPLELLSIGSFGDAPRPRRGGRGFPIGGSSHEPDTAGDAAESNKVWPFSISFIGQGQLGGQYTLWSDSYASRAEWQEKLQHAKVLRAEVNDANKVFEMTPLSQNTFYMAYSYAVPKPEGDTTLTGRVTCSAPFMTPDGRSLVAVGCEEGVWIGLRHDPHSLRKVLHVKAVSHIAVLEEFGIFLVLQDKSLLAYHLEALVPSASSPQVRAAPQRLSPGKDILFFTVGKLSGRTLVLYMKRRGMDSLFRILEPISSRQVKDAASQRPNRFGQLLGQRTDWFRLYKDFFVPTDAVGIHWLKAKLAIVCAKGFEIMDLTDMKGGAIPIFDPTKVRDRPRLAELQRRCDAAKSLGMFRSTETEFLLCYDSFGIYVDRHGEPNRDLRAIDWEGRPDSVAFHPPYVLLVSAPFIEIRHIGTGKLLQIYTGSDIHLTWDGTGGMINPPQDNPGPKGYGDETSSQEPRIHICQRSDDVRRSKGVGQTVFELTPTLALNNPLLNPVHTHDSNYFPPAPMMRSDARSEMSDRRRSSSLMTSNSGEFYAAQHTPPMLGMTSMNGSSPSPGHPNGNGPSGRQDPFPWGTQGHPQFQNQLYQQQQQQQGYNQSPSPGRRDDYGNATAPAGAGTLPARVQGQRVPLQQRQQQAQSEQYDSYPEYGQQSGRVYSMPQPHPTGQAQVQPQYPYGQSQGQYSGYQTPASRSSASWESSYGHQGDQRGSF